MNIFITESKDEDIKDFVVNRNPEFALQVMVNKDKIEKTKDYLDKLREKLKTVNLIKFENLNRFFTTDEEVVRFCARDGKMFKPGSGQFDIIYDVTEKNNQTMKSKFNYLEKLPLRKFKTYKHVLGCSINEQENCALIVELKDANNDLCQEEIEERGEIVVEKGQDAKIRKKFVFAYLVDPNASGDRLDYARKQAED
jgi:hypothetical protein